jgi:flagellar biosynthesis/type III secretory pathway protein FliH
VERLSRELAEAADATEAGVRAAYDQGREAGLGEAADREQDRLEALSAGLEAAATGFAAKLDLLDCLAPALARAALAKLFGETGSWTTMVEAMLARQLAAVRQSGIVAVRVSPLDFGDVEAVAALCGGDVRAELDSELCAGAARIECRLGQVDLDVRSQWQALAALLDGMAEASA